MDENKLGAVDKADADDKELIEDQTENAEQEVEAVEDVKDVEAVEDVEADAQQNEELQEQGKGRKVSLFSCVMSCVFVAVISALICGIYLTNVYSDAKRLAVNNALLTVEERYGELEERFGLLFEIDEAVRENYVSKLNDEDLLYGAVHGYIFGSGDRYMQYMSSEYSKQFIDGNYGTKKGIGVRVSLNTEEDTVYVYQVFKGSPAETAGVKNGDYIVAVDGKRIEDLGAENATNAISGENGTAVRVTVLREGEELELDIVRGDYEIKSVEYEMLDGKVAYFVITGLASDTPAEFEAAVKAAQADGAEKYVFDVRNNSGGYLNSVCEVLDLLLPEGPIIRWTDKDGGEESIDSDAELILDAPMAVIVNGDTASAAELFAAALRDYEKAIVVGETTFGKGSMQSFYPLSDDGVLKLTSSYYYPPFSEGYNGIGVKPDLEVLFEEGVDRFKLSLEEDIQLQAAIKALEKGE